jgi:hypothetical protein
MTDSFRSHYIPDAAFHSMRIWAFTLPVDGAQTAPNDSSALIERSMASPFSAVSSPAQGRTGLSWRAAKAGSPSNEVLPLKADNN